MNTVVIARYAEPMDWIDELPDGWEPWIIQKGKQIPNIGREPASFLYAMREMWVDAEPHDRIAFVQGWPFPHEPDVFLRLAALPNERYVPLGDQHHEDDWHGHPHHGGLPIKKFWEDHVGPDCPRTFPFVAGGQFAITGENLLCRGRDWYDRMFEASLEEKAPWILERLWGSLFG